MSTIDWSVTPAAVWRRHRQALRPVSRLDAVQLADLLGIDRQRAALQANIERFLAGLAANNVLLWGARGTGKSSLIKATLNHYAPLGLRLVQVERDDLVFLPEIVDELADQPWRFVVFSDDLSFDAGDGGYRALKSVLEGSIELPPPNVMIAATSNRRHLLPEYMKDNDAARVIDGEIHPGEAVEEQISLSDRFGLWLSFYPFSQDEYLAIVDHLFPSAANRDELHLHAVRFALGRGVRSGRTAQQFYRSVSGRAY